MSPSSNGGRGGAADTNVPDPGRRVTNPSEASRCMARCTVMGEACSVRCHSRTDATRAPGASSATRVRMSRSRVSTALSLEVTTVDNVINGTKRAHPSSRRALALGFLGVACFSLTFPATRKAVPSLGPWLVTFGRAAIAGVLAIVALRLHRCAQPTRGQARRLALVVAGVVVGFPAFSGLALQHAPAGRSAVITGLLPAATAGLSVLRTGERPSWKFWAWAGLGLAAVLVLLGSRSHGHVATADLLLLGAVLAAAMGYTEGALLARELGGWQTICWALVLALPITVPAALLSLGGVHGPVPVSAWVGLAYLSVVSMFLGFFAWYAALSMALSLGSVAKVSQIQLLQPIMTLTWAWVLLSEPLDAVTVGVAGVVLLAVLGSRRNA